ncbi:MAG: TonB family protein [Puniceicoccales bacterium]|jgi:protein TonB|nr:TonB family protein [Puniceicoccales bacterium]
MLFSATHENPRFLLPEVLTLVLWFFCATICLVGATMKAERFDARAAREPPTPAPELISVQLTNDIVADAPCADTQPPASPESSALRLNAPQLLETPAVLGSVQNVPTHLPLAIPAEVAFALPIEMPPPALVSNAPTSTEVQAAPEAATNNAAPSVSVASAQHLVFGQGQGRQPAPYYPEQARRRNQTGSVRVRFTVAPDGYVTDAMTLIPCKYRLLNEAAVDTVRHRWRFSAGHRRVYEVDIRFELKE